MKTILLTCAFVVVIINGFTQKEVKSGNINGLLQLTPYSDTEFLALLHDSGTTSLYRTDLQFNKTLVAKFRPDSLPVLKGSDYYDCFLHDGIYYIKLAIKTKAFSKKFNMGFVMIDVKSGSMEVYEAEARNFLKDIDYFFLPKEDTSGYYIYSEQKTTTKAKNLEIQLLDKHLLTYEVLNIPYYEEKDNETKSFYVDKDDNVFTLSYGNENKIIVRKYVKGKTTPSEISITIPGDKIGNSDVFFKLTDNKVVLGTFSNSHLTFNALDFETKSVTSSFKKELTEDFIKKLYQKKIISASYDKDKIPNNLNSFTLEAVDITNSGDFILTLQEYKDKGYSRPNYFRNNNNPQLTPTFKHTDMYYVYDIVSICLSPSLEYKWAGCVRRMGWDTHLERIMFKQFITKDYLYYMTPEVKLIADGKGMIQLYKIDLKTGQYIKQLSLTRGCKDKVASQENCFFVNDKYMIIMTSPGGFNFTSTTRVIDISEN